MKISALLLLISSWIAVAVPAPAAEPASVISGIWMMGQSLCDGSESLPVVTAADTGWGNFSFARGVRTWLPKDQAATPEKRAAEQFAFVPLQAKANGGLGETVANGMADHWKAALAGFDKGRAAREGPRFLVACAGQGGRQIQELSSADLSVDGRTPESRRHGGGYYRTSLDDARRAVAQAKAAGKDFRIAALYWMQGEGNGGPTGGIVPTRWDAELPRKEGLAWYRDQLIAYRRQWSADLAAITGQRGELPMFTYQTLGPAGEAQLMAADADDAIHLVGPHYAVPSAINSLYPPGRHGDAIHLSADGERWWGEQVGKVMHRVLQQKEKWEPLRPRRARLEPSRDAIVIDFIVPRPPLVIDTDFLARQESAAEGGFASLAGFQARDDQGRVVALAAVEVTAAERLRIRLAQPLAQDRACTVSYGQPFVAALGRITAVRNVPIAGGPESGELWLDGSGADKLRVLSDEGAFLVAGLDGPAARVPVRRVREEKDAKVLSYDPGELRNGIGFAPGQAVAALRAFSYGNLRDSDPEPSVHVFSDASYGIRAGKAYPLWNWCVLFSGLEVGAPSAK